MIKRSGKTAAAALMLSAVLLSAGCGAGGGETENGGNAEPAATTVTEAPGETSAAETEAPAAEALVFTENKVGEKDGYEYSLWKDSGDTVLTVGDGGTFSCEWKNINNALFRRGQLFDCTKTYRELGDISVEYGIDYQPSGNSYMCVYGWTRDDLIEFYIVDSWGSWRPPGAPFALGTAVIDGAEYDIYKTTRYQQPSIDGTKTFDQYWSVRKEKPLPVSGSRLEGKISVTKHFDAWEKCGLTLGKMYEVALTVEGYQSEGKAEVYKHELKISDTYTEAADIEVTVNEEAVQNSGGEPPEMPEPAGLFSCGFEDGTDGWLPRGGAMVTADTENSADGSGSLFVSGRTDNWNGACIFLDGGTYKPGEVFSFAAKVMQKSGSDVQMKLTMQYTAEGEVYDEVALVTAKDGEWTELSNSAYTIPAGAEDLILYIESPDSLTDFYIDSVTAEAV